jgi:predicted transcriptional regulator
LGKTKSTINKRFENLGTVRQSIEVVFSPYISSKDMKEKISKEKKIIREIQSEIEKLNQNTINVNFEYSDIESLIN